MSDSKKSAPLILITVVAMAAIFAISLYLGAVYLRSRLNNTSQNLPTGPTAAIANIEGKTVQYTIYPDEMVILLPINSNSVLGIGEGTSSTPTPPTPILPTAVPPTPTPDKIIFTSYTVQNGDTLYSVAAHFGWTSTISLMAKYNIAADNIVPGNILTPFPVANPAYCPGRRPYVVEESESAYTISQTVGTTIEVLKEMNNLNDNYTVYVTDVICVP